MMMDDVTAWAVERVMACAAGIREMTDPWYRMAEEMDQVCRRLEGASAPEPEWAFPIGTAEWPVQDWYVSVVHDLTGAKNGGYRHSGIDINLDRWPWGDVERGAPVMACAAGRVVAKGASPGWLGVVVIHHVHDGCPLYVRYAHLDPDRFEVTKNKMVLPGQVLGYLGNYKAGDTGDHLHFDMSNEPFGWDWWLTPRISWMDPVPVLKAHLDVGLVEAMLQKK